MGFAVIDAARTAGVRHFVFSSVLHAITTDLIQHESSATSKNICCHPGWNSRFCNRPTTCCDTGSSPHSKWASSVWP
jgi:hypothetical protein